MSSFRKMEFHPWSETFLIGVAIALSSQLYLNLFINNFRISASVIILPVLLLTLGRQLHTMPICAATGGIVFLFRLLILLLHGDVLGDSIFQVVPGALFYVVYGIIFKLSVSNKHIASLRKITGAVLCADFGANVIEFLLRCFLLKLPAPDFQELATLFFIAAIRTGIVAVILILDRQYRELQVRHEQERRYQKLFLMITGLKSELYLMRKNSEEIERIMGNAYRLHESVQKEALSRDVEKMTLEIARDVHEIKKDYVRIMQGIEETIGGDYEEERMHFHDILEILEATAHLSLQEKKVNIDLRFDCRDDFLTDAHYTLMTILKNLVSNSIEAIAEDRRQGWIFVREWHQGDEYIFEVRDNGPGIPEKNLKKIFRLGYSTKFDEKTGNIYRGVGLAGVKNAVEEQFGGKMSVQSDPGTLTIFQIRIPEHKLIHDADMVRAGESAASVTDTETAGKTISAGATAADQSGKTQREGSTGAVKRADLTSA